MSTDYDPGTDQIPRDQPSENDPIPVPPTEPPPAPIEEPPGSPGNDSPDGPIREPNTDPPMIV